MFRYRVKYTESKSDIQNYSLFYKNTKNAKILSKFWKVNRLFTPKKQTRTDVSGHAIESLRLVRIFDKEYIIVHFTSIRKLFTLMGTFSIVIFAICYFYYIYLKIYEYICICIYIYIYIYDPFIAQSFHNSLPAGWRCAHGLPTGSISES